MRLAVAFALLLAAAAAHADCTPRPQSWITLEIVASEPAGDEPVELIDIDPAGCLTLRYASFDRRAGLYRRQLSAGERDALLQELQRRAILSFDVTSVRADIAAREHAFRRGVLVAGPERFAVACGDTYRLSVDDPAGAVQIEWYAPRQIAERHREVTALSDLVVLFDTLQKLGAAEGKVLIAAVSR